MSMVKSHSMLKFRQVFFYFNFIVTEREMDWESIPEFARLVH